MGQDRESCRRLSAGCFGPTCWQEKVRISRNRIKFRFGAYSLKGVYAHPPRIFLKSASLVASKCTHSPSVTGMGQGASRRLNTQRAQMRIPLRSLCNIVICFECCAPENLNGPGLSGNFAPPSVPSGQAVPQSRLCGPPPESESTAEFHACHYHPVRPLS